MPNALPYAALAAALAIAGPALAQAPSSSAAGAHAKSPPPSSAAAPGGTTAPGAGVAPTTTGPAAAAPPASAPTGSSSDTAANAGASTTLTTGMSVKDNTGAIIGEVRALKGGVATIAMGSDVFTVDASKLGVQGGTAMINATQADIKKMLPPPAKK